MGLNIACGFIHEEKDSVQLKMRQEPSPEKHICIIVCGIF